MTVPVRCIDRPAARGWRGKLGSVKVVFSAELWLWDARRTETWTFVSLPASESEEIRDLAGDGAHRRAVKAVARDERAQRAAHRR